MMALPLVWARREYGMDALQWAYAVEYAKKTQRGKQPRRKVSKKVSFGIFLWFLGIG